MIATRLVLVAGALMITNCAPPPYDGGFDPRAWQTADTGDRGNPRLEIADDLVRFGRLVGRSRREVVALLGPPEVTNYFSEYDMVYVLGPERGFISIDYEWLVLRLDRKGKVVEARVATD